MNSYTVFATAALSTIIEAASEEDARTAALRAIEEFAFERSEDETIRFGEVVIEGVART